MQKLVTHQHVKADQIFFALRILLAIIIAAHGWARWWHGAVEPFGGWLDQQGIPFGVYLAYGITLVEVVGSLILAFGLLVTPLCLVYILIYTTGLFMVHMPDGWFVVGLGRNGMEYSVLLIACLLAQAYWHFGRGGEEAR